MKKSEKSELGIFLDLWGKGLLTEEQLDARLRSHYAREEEIEGEKFQLGEMVISDDTEAKGPWKVVGTRTVRQIQVEYHRTQASDGSWTSHRGGWGESKFYKRKK